MEGTVDRSLVGFVAENDGPFIRRQIDFREKEADPVSFIAQADMLQVDCPVGTVPDLDPVTVLTVFIGHGSLIGRHNLTDHQSVIGADNLVLFALHQAGLGRGGIGRAVIRLFRRDEHQQDEHRDKTGQQDKVHPALPAAKLCCSGNRTASLVIRFPIHASPSLSVSHKSCKVYHKLYLTAITYRV